MLDNKDTLDILTMKHHIPLILFSGGMDSTFLLRQALMTQDVETLYVRSQQGPEKIAMELRARKRIIKILEKECGHKVINDKEATIDIRLIGEYSAPKFAQVKLWLMGALQAVQEKHSGLFIGYVMGDQVSSHLEDIRTVWNSLQSFSIRSSTPIHFPLRYISKRTILPELSKKLRSELWVCESPIKKSRSKLFAPCGKCHACSTLDIALYTEKRDKGKID